MTFPILEQLDPLIFCQAWNLTYAKASEYLYIEPRTINAYACKGRKTHREPSLRVKVLAAKTHNQWIQEGRIPVKIESLVG